jgi:hypothetical protein
MWKAFQIFEIAAARCSDKPRHVQQVFGGDNKEDFALMPMNLTEHIVAQLGGLFEKILQERVTGGAPSGALLPQ